MQPKTEGHITKVTRKQLSELLQEHLVSISSDTGTHFVTFVAGCLEGKFTSNR
jgi:hypothetical protein